MNEEPSQTSTHKLRKSVHKNRHSHAKMAPEKQIITCAICLEDNIKSGNLAKLDGCAHQYCYDCILQWTKDCENSCPQCKAKIKQITRKDKSGADVVEVVLNL